MIRALSIAAALALCVAAPLTAEAGSKKYNACKATTIYGKPVTYKCKADEKCCFSKLTSMKSCVPKSGVCL
ncbi:MAG: hypothetical protein NW217_07465 [Hyphomicrobiaceae bacterium]|nr:hypothetical protein [Hyphomicrobiaceae bacterium]